jgi:hypothetical protein
MNPRLQIIFARRPPCYISFYKNISQSNVAHFCKFLPYINSGYKNNAKIAEASQIRTSVMLLLPTEIVESMALKCSQMPSLN